MSENPPTTMSEQQLREINRISRQFERDLRGGGAPSLTQIVQQAPAAIRELLFLELLFLEMERHRDLSGTISLDGYLSRFPTEFADKIQSVYDEVISQSTEDVTLADEFEAGQTQMLDSDDTASHGARAARPPTSQSEQPLENVPAARSGTAAARIEQSSEPDGHHDERFDNADTLVGQASMTSKESVEIPDRIGRYRILRLLGSGGMGAVFLAHDEQLDRQVAIKVPRFDRNSAIEEPELAIERFYREARTMATLRHPNLCPVYDVGEVDGRHYLTMAYLQGETLSAKLKAGQQISPIDAASIAVTMADALQTAHERGVVHRDLKPANVMIDLKGQPIIMDFGLARRVNTEDASLTQSGAIMGSPAYMAPEQVEAQHDLIGPSTDVYAVGVILYHMLCGRRPFEGSVASVLGQIATGPPPEAPTAQRNVDHELESICLKAMSRQINDRFASARDLAEALTQYLDTRSGDSDQNPASFRTRFGLKNSRRQTMAITAGVSSVAVVLALVVPQLRPTGNESGESSPPVKQIGSVVEDESGTQTAAGGSPSPLSHAINPSTGHFVDSGQELGMSSSGAVAAGDVDGDGDIDAVVLSTSKDAPNCVWLNDGDGKFEPGQEFATSVAGRADLKLGDMDGDGNPDVVVASTIAGCHVWQNDGAGQFEQRDQQTETVRSTCLALGDIDGDGDLDVIAGGTDAVRILRNDGTGNLQHDSGQVLNSRFSYHCTDVELADLDSDGDPDIFACNQDCANRVWWNDGHGRFSEGHQSLGRRGHRAVALADADDDGDIDAWVVSEDHDNVLWLNNGGGSFGAVETLDWNAGTAAAAIADLNGDGVPDLFAGNGAFSEFPCANQIVLREDDGESQNLWFGLEATVDVALADFDGDGDVDAFLANQNKMPDRLWLNRNIDEPDPSPWDFRFRDTGQELGKSWSDEVVLGDLDNDGDLDAVVANNQSDPCCVWLNDGKGYFGAPAQLLGEFASVAAALGDLDNDGDHDIFFAGRSGPNQVWLNNGDGQFTDTQQMLGQSSGMAIALGDLDGDGDPDAIVANSEQPDCIWLNDGTGRFTMGGRIETGFKSRAVVVSDFDGDNDLDVVIGGDYRSRMWLNDGNAEFTAGNELDTNHITTRMAIGDVDGDHDIDIVLGIADRPNQVHLNDGNGHCHRTVQLLGSFSTHDVVLWDLDHDGDLDLITGNLSGPIGLWMNDGNGRFHSVRWVGLEHPGGLAIGDLDGDSNPDLFIANYTAAYESTPDHVWLNESVPVDPQPTP